MNKFEYKNLTTFKWFVLENFPFLEADYDALTEWQLFCKLGKEINKIIDSQNIVGEQSENLTNAFNNLKNYVDNYFDNLDEEIGRVNTVINLLEEEITKVNLELDVLRQKDTELKNDISKNADEITNLKNENAYLQNVVKQAFTETSASGTELTIDNTIEARMEMKLNGNTSQNGEPTPNTPQEIHCVKGNNVVKVTNQNLFSEEYPINLENYELNSISDFKDYFKKENGKWYKVEKIKSIIADGTNYLCKYMFPNGTFFIYSNAEKNTSRDALKVSNLSLFSNYLISKKYTAVFNNGEVGACYNISTGEIGVNIGISTNKEDINTWLSTHNLMIKYILQTPNQIEITDTTLITQLDEISQALSQKGTTIISQNNDDLPFNLDVIALTK